MNTAAPVMDEASQLLMKAADIMRNQDHLLQYDFARAGCVCTYASVLAAEGKKAEDLRFPNGGHTVAGKLALVRLARTIDPNTDAFAATICHWNNEAGRTKEEAAELLEKAAKAGPTI
jgi:hypothetical protein